MKKFGGILVYGIDQKRKKVGKRGFIILDK